MALTTPSASPAVTVREIDLSGVAPNVQTSTGALVGDFKWGPIGQRVLVSNENELVSAYGTPSEGSAVDFLSAAYFLKYSNSLYVVRAGDDSAKNSTSFETTPATVDADGTVVSPAAFGSLVKNADHWDQFVSTVAPAGSFYAKYAGSLGNSIFVSYTNAAGFNTWNSSQSGWSDHKDSFDAAPEADEIHVIVRDKDGKITGTAGAVLETYAFVSTVKGSKTEQGSNNYVSDVVNTQSRYIWMGEMTSANSGSYELAGGEDVTAPSYDYSIFSDVDTVTVDFLISTQEATFNDLIGIAQKRKDCVAVGSPRREDVINNPNFVSAITDWANALTKSSYAVVDSNYFKVYDKYNDKYVFIPASSSTAGLMAATDAVAAPWFSPAGDRRGNYLAVTDVAQNPTKGERDSLYKLGINPVANIPGSGVVLYGDKTFMVRPSAFDRINVRRLFLTIERSIAIAGKNVMFEFNDEFTRAEFVNIVEPLLREIQGRRGITDFRVVCDDTNNTSAVVDRNEFVASIFIKPARSINYVTLNFVAVRTGVEFEEVVGLV